MAIPLLIGLSPPFNGAMVDPDDLCSHIWQAYHQALVDQLAALSAAVSDLQTRVATLEAARRGEPS